MKPSRALVFHIGAEAMLIAKLAQELRTAAKKDPFGIDFATVYYSLRDIEAAAGNILRQLEIEKP